jgi:Mn-containing catalase
VPSKAIAKPIEHEKKSIGSFDLSQDSFDTNNALSNKNSPSRRYSGSYINSSKPLIKDFLKKNTHPSKQMKDVKLPIIKEKKDKNQFQDLVQMMKVRKRGHGGFYEDNGSVNKGKVE